MFCEVHARIGVVVLCAAAAGATGQVTFQWAAIGHPGNAPDPLTGFGSVASAFEIATTEVTNAQYAEFLNDVARSDPTGLYNPSMAGPLGGIERQGIQGLYSYSVVAERGDHPVNFVSLFDTMRFINWLHNDQDADGTESGAYDMASAFTATRSVGARFFLPDENEWYKAAYFQPAASGGDADDYWLFPTSSNAVPLAGTDANFANFFANTTPVRQFSPNAYGLYDLAGNVWERNESILSAPNRGIRGGWYGSNAPDLRATDRVSGGGGVDAEGSGVGFRVARPAQAAPTCPADLSGPGGEPDDVLNSSDFLAFLNLWSTSDPSADLAPPGGNGVWDSSDFLAYLNLYAQGCP